MAPVVVTAVPPPLPPKIKRPPHPIVQTNGASSSKPSSASPSIPSKILPPVAITKNTQPANPTSTGVNGAGVNGTSVNGTIAGSNRPPVPRPRRDTLNPSSARGPKTGAVLRPPASGQDKALTQLFEPRPEGLAAPLHLSPPLAN